MRVFCKLALVFVLGAAPLLVAAQAYPSRPINFIVPFTPGSGPDIVARLLGQKLAERWKQPVVVDNKPGASGNIGANAVAKSQPDGHALIVTPNTFALAPVLYKSIPFDPIADFAAVGKIAVGSYALTVNPGSLPFLNFSDVLAALKAKPGQYNYGSPGNGTPQHVLVELLKFRTGVNVTHVPYKGAAGANTDLLSGQIQLMFLPTHTALPFARSGKLRIVAVTGAARSALVPDVQTFRENGIDYMDSELWFGMLAPAKTPPEIIAKLNQEIISILALADVRETLLSQGLVPTPGKPEELAALVRSDLARWKKVVDDAKITAD